ncbi:MAG: efflux RND transporter permease subunit [Acidobacteriota bacterium]|nr:efflux RND transporter permease subunit [Acidobacteriota bacterium]
MLNAIVGFSIRFRGVVVALASALLVYGFYALTQAKYDVFPEFAPPQISIQTEAPGLSAEQVEVLVTQPVEIAIQGVAGVESVRSASIQGLSVITAIFDAGSDIYRNRQVIAERLASVAPQLPQGVATPGMTPLTSSTSTVLVAGLTSTTRSLMELRTLADWTIRPRLLAISGVAKVSVFGGDARQIQVQVDPQKLTRFHLGWNEVLDSARRATGVRAAGFVETANQRVVFQTIGQPATAREIAATPLVEAGGGIVRLADIGSVVDAAEPPIGAFAVGGRPGVGIVVAQQYGSNTLEVSSRVEAALAEFAPALATQEVTLSPRLFRPADFIETATRNVRSALLLGGALVIVVLFLFLFDLRTAAISCSAIPLSLLAGVIVLQRLGITLNTMTLGGLAIAIGQVVDDAIIDVENILRRLRESQGREEKRPVWRVVLDASIEVRAAVVYATFAIILVFFPILTLSGVAGRLFAPLGISYIAAVLASLLVALTVTPALAMLLLGKRRLPQEEPPVMRWTKARYRRLLERVERRPKPVLWGVAALLLAGLLTLPFSSASFLPELKEGHFIVHMSLVPGSSLAESLRVGGKITEALGKLPFVRSVAQQVGRAEKAEDTWGPHYSEFQVDLKKVSGNEAESAREAVREVFSRFPGTSSSVKTFLTERVEETLSGYTASVVVNVYGNDLDALDGIGRQVSAVLGGIEGASEVQVQSPPGMPQLSVKLRPEELARFGFRSVDVLDTVSAAYQGEIVGQVYEGNRVFPVAVILDPRSRGDVARVGELTVRNAAGTYVPLRGLADIFETSGRYQVLRQAARRVQTITANVAGRSVASFVTEARRRIGSAMTLPAGVQIEFAGTAQAQARSLRDLILHSLFAGLGVVLLVSIVTGSTRNLLLILTNLPFALVGGVLAAFAMGGNLSLGSLVGFVTLFGVTLRNSILMISHYEHLVDVEGMKWGPEAALQGASDRLVPILMTSLVTALGLLPLALGRNAPGREIEGPMAVVILGGLLTSMALNLLVLPTLALRYGRFERGSG